MRMGGLAVATGVAALLAFLGACSGARTSRTDEADSGAASDASGGEAAGDSEGGRGGSSIVGTGDSGGTAGLGDTGGIAGTGGVSGTGGVAGTGGVGGSSGSAGGSSDPDAGVSCEVVLFSPFVSGAASCGIGTCGGSNVCSNCVDDDGDGLADDADPECMGPCDESEDDLAVLKYISDCSPGWSSYCVTDCYFDSSCGRGDDGCAWSYRCDPLSVASSSPPYTPTGSSQCAYEPEGPMPFGTCADLASEQPCACLSHCLPITPNGCDCFGCCTIPRPAGGTVTVWLGDPSAGGPHCTFAQLDDPEVCAPCTQVPSCLNPCETCELCIGKLNLPESCPADTTGTERCPAGLQACGLPSDPACPTGRYCITGCCR